MSRKITVIIIIVLLLAVAATTYAAGQWRDSQAVLWPRDRLYVYCPTGVQVVRQYPNTTVIHCYGLEERRQ